MCGGIKKAMGKCRDGGVWVVEERGLVGFSDSMGRGGEWLVILRGQGVVALGVLLTWTFTRVSRWERMISFTWEFLRGDCLVRWDHPPGRTVARYWRPKKT